MEEDDRMPRAARMIVPILGLLLWPCWAAGAAEGGDALHLDGGELSMVWVLPFAGILLSIALFPLLAPSFWHHHFGKISFAWALAFLAPFAIEFGLAVGKPAHLVVLEAPDVLEALRNHAAPVHVVSHGRVVDAVAMRALASA